MRWPIYVVVTMALFLTACGEPRRASPTRPAPVDPPPSATPTAGVPASPTPTAVAATLGRLGFVENGNLWIEDVPNGQPRQVTRDGHDGSPRWSSSGKWLAFVRHDPGARSEQLRVVDAATGASRQIATGDAFDEKPGDRVAWSPLAADGTDRLAYVSNGSLYLVSPGNADPAREVVAKNPSPGLGVTGIAWSPDGKWLAYTRVVDRTPGPAGSAQTPNASLWKVRADGTRQTEIVSADHPPYGDLFVARWSADGTRILYWKEGIFSASILADGVALMAVPAAGGVSTQVDPRMLTHLDFLSASPNGQRLALVDGGGRETWTGKTLVFADLGGVLHRVTSPAGVSLFPSWSPRGDTIAFVNQPETRLGEGPDVAAAAAGRQIWICAPDGSNARRLTDDPSFRDERPEWSADGKTILFARIQGSHASLWAMNADGSDQRSLVSDLGSPFEPAGYYGYVDWARYYDWWPGP